MISYLGKIHVCNDKISPVTRKNKFNFIGAIVLGMHDALVSLTGLIAGLAFAMADRYAIILTSVIASVTASLSMGASNYLAMRANNQKHPIRGAMYTGGAYMITCAMLILPFFIFENRWLEIATTLVTAIFIIFIFNWGVGRIQHQPYIKKFIEMVTVCTTVSIVAFFIGWCAKYCLGIEV